MIFIAICTDFGDGVKEKALHVTDEVVLSDYLTNYNKECIYDVVECSKGKHLQLKKYIYKVYKHRLYYI